MKWDDTGIAVCAFLSLFCAHRSSTGHAQGHSTVRPCPRTWSQASLTLPAGVSPSQC